jgi:hypothetical protein
MTSTYVPQTGGNHYEYGDVNNQHWDLMDCWDIEYLAATASKYIVRYDRKGTPRLDLEKSISYLTKQVACHPNKGCRRLVPQKAMLNWYEQNDLSVRKQLLLDLIHVDGSPRALSRAIFLMKEVIDAEYPS